MTRLTSPRLSHRSYLLLLALVMLPGAWIAAAPNDATHQEWDTDVYRQVSGAPSDAYEVEEPVGDERLDRIKNRDVAPGAYNINALLGVPSYQLVEESLEKYNELETQRGLLEGSSLTEEGPLHLNLDVAGVGKLPEEQLAEDGMRIVSSGFLEIDIEGRTVISDDRSVVTINEYRLEADRLVINAERNEIQASGNIVFESISSGNKFEGDSIVFDFKKQVGYIENAEGGRSVLRLVRNAETGDVAAFESLDENTSLFNHASLTTDDFPKPMYRIRGTEVILLRGERFFVLNAVLYVRELPTMYFPIFTRRIGGPLLPWDLLLGYNDGGERELGYFAILTYNFYHRTVEPSQTRPGEYDMKSQARIAPFAFYSSPSIGVGLEGRYDLNRSQHKGEFFSFYTGEHDDRSSELNETDDERFAVDFKHRTRIGKSLDLMTNIDWVSDSEVYFDYFDRFYDEDERGRQAERRGLIAMTWTRDDYLARVLYERKERLGRDRINNYGEPYDDDADYNQFVDDPPLEFRENNAGPPDPNNPNPPENIPNQEVGAIQVFPEFPAEAPEDLDPEDEQLDRDRYGLVTEREPEFHFQTSRLPIFNKPIYWSFDLRAFNNLDKGLNTLDEEDDSFVRGFDAYNSLTNVVNFSEQYAWRNQIGFGFGRADRDDDEYDLLPEVMRKADTEPYQYIPIEYPVRLQNGMYWVDPNTFLVGRDEVSLDDVSDDFVYGDFESEFDMTFSEKLRARVRYRFREGTDDHLGEFYRKVGDRDSRDDLFDFRLRQNRIDGDIEYDFLYPRIKLSLDGGYNFDGDDDLTNDETIAYFGPSAEWTSMDDVWSASATANWVQTQIRDPSDVNAFEGQSIALLGEIDYFPLHERFWAKISGNYFKDLEDDPLDEYYSENTLDPNLGDREDDLFEDDGLRWQVEPLVGFRVGPKWEVEGIARYDEEEEDIDKAHLVFSRDLNDATLIFGIFWDLDAEVEVNERGLGVTEDVTTRLERRISYDFGYAFKLPNRDRFTGSLATETVVSQRRSEMELGG